MTGALNVLRLATAELLRESGVQAVAAMEAAPRKRWEEPVAAVSLSKLVCAPGGFRDYLGLREDPDSGGQEEIYGREVELTLGLDVYAPRESGESACQQVACRMAEVLACRDLAGLSVEEFETGAVEFLERDGLYHLPAQCRCRGWMAAEADGSGSFVDFEVKGRKL